MSSFGIMGVSGVELIVDVTIEQRKPFPSCKYLNKPASPGLIGELQIGYERLRNRELSSKSSM